MYLRQRYINACNDMYPASWVRVSNELGAGKGKGARFAIIVSVLTSIAIGLFFFILVLIFHNELALAFSSSEAVLQVVKNVDPLTVYHSAQQCSTSSLR